ncbi:response regulator FixJ [Methylobacterium sp. P31]
MARSLIHVVDDDSALRDSLGFLLDTAGFEVALYKTGTDLLDRLAKPARDGILTDIRMPGIDGLGLLRRLRADSHTLPVVMMTGHGDVALAVEAMKLGACDFIEKPFDDEVLLHALHAALDRGGVTEEADPTLQEFVRRVATLSWRERQVLDQLVAGRTSKGIGRALDISPRTVEIYRAKLMAKTQASSLSEVVRWSVLAGLGQA